MEEKIQKEHISLPDDQRFALMKFRRAVADCCTKPYHDDRYLLRWLRARRWDLTAAEKMLRESLEWRKIWDIDGLKDWELPEVYKKYYPYGLPGYDKDGSPVAIAYFAGLDTYGILHASSKKDMVRATAKILEEVLELCREQAKKHGPAALQITFIVDMVHFNLKQFRYIPAAEILLQLIQIYEAHYPEVLKVCYLVNVPRVFMFAFNVVKGFLNEDTINKILLFNSNSVKWKAAILKTVPADQLPVYFGGTLVDPDGNPKCPSIISPGGKVPESMYTTKGNSLLCDEKYTTAVVKSKQKLELELTATEDGSFLRWSFRTDGHDIKFGILKKNGKNESEDVELSLRKVSCQRTEEIGFVTCTANTTYKVIFDNQYSFIRSKTLHYNISITPPLPKQELTPDKFVEIEN